MSIKVLIVPSWYPNDLNPIRGIFFKEQAQALQKCGYDVIVAYPEIWSLTTLGKHSDKKGISFKEEDGLRTYRFNGYNMLPKIPNGTDIMYYKGLKKLYKQIKQQYGKPDIIHLHSSLSGGYGASKLSKSEKIPLVITEHSTAFSRGIIKDSNKNIIRDAFDVAKKVIVVGPGLKKDLKEYANESKTVTIPNIVNVEKFNIEIGKTNKKKFRFFSLGLLSYKKGMDILLTAFSQLDRNEIELVIGGDGEERETLKKLSKDLNIADNVKFIGSITREQVKEEMNKCDAFVLASRHETFGVVFIEALACGKPIIATKCGGPEIIVNNNNGYLISKENVEELSKAMNDIIKNYGNFNSQEIRKDCINRFSEEAVIKQIRKVYEEVL